MGKKSIRGEKIVRPAFICPLLLRECRSMASGKDGFPIDYGHFPSQTYTVSGFPGIIGGNVGTVLKGNND